MTRPGRGGPGQFSERLVRARRLSRSVTAGEPLTLACAVLEQQMTRAVDPTVTAASALLADSARASQARDRYPRFDLDAAADPVLRELHQAVPALAGAPVVPEPLSAAASALLRRPRREREELVRTWLDDPSLLDARLGMWIGVAAGPVLEIAAADTPPPLSGWKGPACPLCGGLPQASVIEERSGEFLGGSPRWLVCGRCASWWRFDRATCPTCREARPRHLSAYVAEGMGWVRLDTCDTCKHYTKTFDLREDGARDVVPLVDDVASLTLDLWAHENGWRRPTVSLAGV